MVAPVHNLLDPTIQYCWKDQRSCDWGGGGGVQGTSYFIASVDCGPVEKKPMTWAAPVR
jgi:hypothetical protein